MRIRRELLLRHLLISVPIRPVLLEFPLERRYTFRMIPAAPIVQPQPIMTVVAPAPVAKQTRDQQPVKTQTQQAVDASEKGERSTTTRRRRHRGLQLDIFV